MWPAQWRGLYPIPGPMAKARLWIQSHPHLLIWRALRLPGERKRVADWETDQAGATMPTTGLLRGFPPMEPKYPASPKLNTPPSAATSQ